MPDPKHQIGKSLVLGFRGADPESAVFREDLEQLAMAQIGGVVLFDRDLASGGDRNILSPAQLRSLTACLRETLGDDLLIMVDQEGGRVARLNRARGFVQGPSASEFALLDDAGQRRAAAEQAQQLAGLGINVNLAPVVDLAIDQRSAVINGLGRSFGADPGAVVRCARTWIRAHASAGVASCIKHFPGHGSAAGDTHEGLVDITGRPTADDEISPYIALSQEPGTMVMTGHLMDRAVDDELPASLSAPHTTGSLREGTGFAGLIVTDSIDMGAVRSHWSPGQAAVMALAAGADLVMDGCNAPGPARPCPAIELVDAVGSAIISGDIGDAADRLQQSADRRRQLLRSISR